MQNDRPPAVVVRAAEESDVDQLARLWYDGWRDAHQLIVPAALAQMRTLESFKARLQAALPTLRVAGPPGSPLAFFMLRGDELYQFYVSAQSRGTGLAAALMADAEAELREGGVETAWLSCAIGNDRAARFYEKCGWHRAGRMIDHTVTAGGTFPLETWRYEKVLS
jgi:GNAT superfamily N-acetyltransferase